MQNNPTYLAQQQAFLDSTLSASTATYNLVIVSPLALSRLPQHKPVSMAFTSMGTSPDREMLACSSRRVVGSKTLPAAF